LKYKLGLCFYHIYALDDGCLAALPQTLDEHSEELVKDGGEEIRCP
jgi:hypothetical protein